MYKKIIFIVTFILCLFFGIDVIKAKSYDCAYELSFGDTKYTFTITFDPEKKTHTYSNICWDGGLWCRGGSLGDVDWLLLEYDESLADAKEELLKQQEENLYSGFCDSTLLVFRYWSNGAQHHYFKVLFNDTLEANAREYMKGNFSSGTYKELTDKWSKFNEDNSTADAKDIAYSCDQYKILFNKIDSVSKSIKQCDGACLSEYSEYENTKQKLKNFCNIQYQHLDYGKSCLNACLNAQSDIEALGIEKIQKKYTCGFSEKLILWIANIIKWGKYLIPIVVIILGILDFIKAISSDKEDQMKKAQGSFIKRLLVCALIFILPFIIEFILNKMGFGANGCGIIDL